MQDTSFLLFKPYLKLASVNFPSDKVNVLETNEHIHVEPDSEVKTQ